jgi:phytoene desaturase
MNRKKAIIIGAGFSGLSAASFLAKDGFDVTVLEKNSIPGGRARKFEAEGFTFDMGPSWYWMPDVFEKFFASFDKKPGDYYQLKRLDPSYRIVWGENDFSDLPASFEEYCDLFESLEKGSAVKLMKFLEGAQYKYNVGINKLVYKKSASPFEFADAKLIAGIFKLDVFKSFHDHVRSYFTHPKLIQMLEFPVLFLGGTPKTTPALYSLMNHGDIMLGTWYPEGGIYKVVEGMETLAKSLGVEFIYNAPVSAIEVTDRKATGVIANGKTFRADVIIGSADYNHVEQQLLPEEYRTYTKSYWESRVMSPSSLIYYLGINKVIPNLKHHTLIFDEDFSRHADEIYKHPQWPARPAVYISNTSKSDTTVAPAGMENIMVLIPVAPGLNDTEEIRERYYQYAIEKIEKYTGEAVGKHVVFKRSYAHQDFMNDYYAYKGNAYGLANTLMQTAFLKPKMQSKKIKNLFYAGQLTVPGPGVPPAIISGQVVAREIVKLFKNQ